MKHPYQCLVALERVGSQEVKLLLAASAHNLLSIDLTAGEVRSIWSAAAPSNAPPDSSQPETAEGPPEKKRKVLDDSAQRPRIIKLVASRDGQHIVAVTGEDKCVRVFSLDPSGALKQLSERSMPKRPCAVVINQDGQTILCADKFGDVYALPLHHTVEDEQAFVAKAEQTPKAFVPSATNLTVHTARNRKALEAQLKQQDTQAKSKEPLRFKHELLLGHVSMLTDLLFVTLDAEDLEAEPKASVSGPRSYILTADRDEHIRISRGQPQSHIIEGFCLGHKEFISKMCLATPQVLVSGGGDDHLFVWDWLKGKLLRKISLRDILSSVPDAGEFAGEKRRELNIAVSGLWGVPQAAKEKRAILVALEGVPALISINVEALQGAEKVQATATAISGNVLDVAAGSDGLIISVDNIHVPGSTTNKRSEQEAEEAARLLWADSAAAMSGNEQLGRANQLDTAETSNSAGLGELLYGIANLRKRGGGGDE
ncbi:tRNA (guanine-N(7)-)-methyltransferase non-catalytic subunit trm82 [Lasiodiplodia hormozganensis]|uniref:tRNA (Guanine-N(7)-)-methyltransferase non-catalytic subunit trm82 n=1 Tax=Lasiodiplodia hormozganensis TaxID=869390 RepID=A0AA40CWX6_9PEZI|nr:tRNA (guanine-N(7)-)-methyltransferase non-catalytic subunit trm82 [Lasiodiplodia hormozganensis]